jgi:peptide chain release factor subunit 3
MLEFWYVLFRGPESNFIAEQVVKVISARKGEFETGFERGGQTREHAILAKTAGVKRLVVVINKMDDPTVNWSKER